MHVKRATIVLVELRLLPNIDAQPPLTTLPHLGPLCHLVCLVRLENTAPPLVFLLLTPTAMPVTIALVIHRLLPRHLLLVKVGPVLLVATVSLAPLLEPSALREHLLLRGA